MPRRTRAGQRDQYLYFERKTVTGQNSIGEDIVTWATLFEAWGSVKYLQGRELQAAQQRWAKAKYESEILRHPEHDLRAADRCLWGTKYLNILDVRGEGTREPEWCITAEDYVE